MLSALISELQQRIQQKCDIQLTANNFPQGTSVLVGDDCAAIPDANGYLLFAAEGMSPALVEKNSWFAGWCAVLVNVSDIYAMGGRPIAVVDTLWSHSLDDAQPLWEGMVAASNVFNVPIVGGHTNCHSHYNALSVAILGRATTLISSFQAQEGDRLVLVTDWQGTPHPQFPFCWDAATEADPEELQAKLNLLPHLAEIGLCDAGKDISMGGIVGTTLMLLETSGCGAVLDLDAIPCPQQLSLQEWLLSFPSYGFLLSVRPQLVNDVQSVLQTQNLVSAVVGEVKRDPVLMLKLGTDLFPFWDLRQDSLTGFTGD